MLYALRKLNKAVRLIQDLVQKVAGKNHVLARIRLHEQIQRLGNMSFEWSLHDTALSVLLISTGKMEELKKFGRTVKHTQS